MDTITAKELKMNYNDNKTSKLDNTLNYLNKQIETQVYGGRMPAVVGALSCRE